MHVLYINVVVRQLDFITSSRCVKLYSIIENLSKESFTVIRYLFTTEDQFTVLKDLVDPVSFEYIKCTKLFPILFFAA